MRLGLAAALGLAATSLCPQVHADTLIDNVQGLTLAADGAAVRFNGVLVDDHGRVQQLFQRADKRPARVDYRLDGRNRVLMPGLIDAHVELMRMALSRIAPPAPGARPRPEDRDQALIDIQKLLLQRGITAVVDMGTTSEDWQTYRRAGDLGTLQIRIVGYAASVDDMVLIAGPRPTPWLYDDRLRLIGLRIAFNGAPRPVAARRVRAAARATPRPPEPVIQLKNLLSRAGIDGFQPAVTVGNPAALPALLDAIGELSQTYKGERRWRIDTASVPGEAELARMAQSGVALTLLPGSGASGTALAPLTAARVRYAFGSGANGMLADPYSGFAAALRREDALAAETSAAAWAAFADGKFGRIAIGQRADFILIDRDPLLASLGELPAVKVWQTWVGGRMVYRAPEDAAPMPAAGDR